MVDVVEEAVFCPIANCMGREFELELIRLPAGFAFVDHDDIFRWSAEEREQVRMAIERVEVERATIGTVDAFSTGYRYTADEIEQVATVGGNQPLFKWPAYDQRPRFRAEGNRELYTQSLKQRRHEIRLLENGRRCELGQRSRPCQLGRGHDGAHVHDPELEPWRFEIGKDVFGDRITARRHGPDGARLYAWQGVWTTESELEQLYGLVGSGRPTGLRSWHDHIWIDKTNDEILADMAKAIETVPDHRPIPVWLPHETSIGYCEDRPSTTIVQFAEVWREWLHSCTAQASLPCDGEIKIGKRTEQCPGAPSVRRSDDGRWLCERCRS